MLATDSESSSVWQKQGQADESRGLPFHPEFERLWHQKGCRGDDELKDILHKKWHRQKQREAMKTQPDTDHAQHTVEIYCMQDDESEEEQGGDGKDENETEWEIEGIYGKMGPSSEHLNDMGIANEFCKSVNEFRKAVKDFVDHSRQSRKQDTIMQQGYKQRLKVKPVKNEGLLDQPVKEPVKGPVKVEPVTWKTQRRNRRVRVWSASRTITSQMSQARCTLRGARSQCQATRRAECPRSLRGVRRGKRKRMATRNLRSRQAKDQLLGMRRHEGD